mmetsp:Transcript_24465/g.60703  ORF Transcript_24465/g.60703 Transcript_24465/m.60703 type:complete len:253 (+) Transcript_24465:497-1255(+)
MLSHVFHHRVASCQVGILDVGSINDRLRREQPERLNRRPFLLSQLGLPSRPPLVQNHSQLLKSRHLFGLGLPRFDVLRRPLQSSFDLREVRERKLEGNHFDVAQGIDRARDVDDVFILEAPHDVHDRVALADVGEELIAQPLPFRCAGDKPGDIDKAEGRGHRLPRIVDVGEHFELRIGDGHDSGVRLNRAEGEVRRLGLRLLHQCIEQRRLAHVRKAHNACLESHAHLPGARRRTSQPRRAAALRGRCGRL